MRNRTAVQLLYVLAVIAGLLPPILFLAYAFRQSAAQVERDLDFIGTGSLVRAENVIDSVAGTLRKVATLANYEMTPETVSTLRQAVFLNRFIQAIRIRDGDRVICSSEDGLDPRITSTAAPVPSGTCRQVPELPVKFCAAAQACAKRGSWSRIFGHVAAVAT